MDERRKLEMLTLATYLYGKHEQWDNFKRQYILSKIAGAEYIYIGIAKILHSKLEVEI